MRGNEFVRAVLRLAKARDVPARFEADRGKGSHGTLLYGDKRTIVRSPRDELKPGTLRAMLKQLGLTSRDLDKG